MNPQPQFSIQLTDDQWEDVRKILEQLCDEARAGIQRFELRSLALQARGGDFLLSRLEAGILLTIKPGTVAKERREGKLPAAPHWNGKFSFRALLDAYDLSTAANDNSR